MKDPNGSLGAVVDEPRISERRKTMRVYLSGPMSGLPEYNRAAFEEAAASLRADGFEVLSPVEMDIADVNSMDDPTLPEKYWRFLARDIVQIAESNLDGIMVLPGWAHSKGARLEIFQAVLLQIPVYSYTLRRALHTNLIMAELFESVRTIH